MQSKLIATGMTEEAAVVVRLDRWLGERTNLILNQVAD
jgi:hypothetical protein